MLIIWSFLILFFWPCINANNNYADVLHKHMWANFSFFSGDVESARAFFQNITQSSYSKYTIKGYVLFLFEKKEYQKIIDLYQKYKDTFDHNKELLRTYALVLSQVGKAEEADEIFVKLSIDYPQEADIVFYAVNAYMKKKEYQNALMCIDTLLNSRPTRSNDFVFLFLKAQINLSLNNKILAKQIVQKALDMQPHFDKGWLLLSALAEDEGDTKEAITGYTKFLSLSKDKNDDVRRHLMHLIMKEKLIHKTHTPFGTQQDCVDQVIQFIQYKKYDQALNLINKCLSKDSLNTEFNLVKLEILVHLNKHEDILGLLKNLIQHAPEEYLWYKILHLVCIHHIPYSLAYATFDTLIKESTDKILPSLYCADLCLQNENWHCAQQRLTTILPTVKDKIVQSSVRHQIALTQFMQQHYQDMAQTLSSLLIDNPDHVPSLNLLAYYYATKGNDLDVAYGLIARARAIDAHNPHLIDTHGFVLYKKQKYQEAHDLFTLAYQYAPDDATILIHLAQTEYKQTQQANEKMQHYLLRAQEYATYPYEQTKIAKLLAKCQIPRQL